MNPQISQMAQKEQERPERLCRSGCRNGGDAKELEGVASVVSSKAEGTKSTQDADISVLEHES
jgi:hypothetical protein